VRQQSHAVRALPALPFRVHLDSIGLKATLLDRSGAARGRWLNVSMRETPADLAAMQALLDRSHAAGGAHLLRILTPERRLTAEQVAERLTGMRLLALATVTADGRPIVGPVDGVFLRGAFHFGSAPDSLRFRHIRARPQVSATHLPGEELAVTVHGRAVPVDVHGDEGAELKAALLEIYVPRYGPGWEKFLDSGVAYARIEAERMFTFHMEPEGAQTS
jgi:nitroimidazol reductase NimA-like FMN-containing flavoprotein (pyridoxamine 5'-phosphate oxidase superfamily)